MTPGGVDEQIVREWLARARDDELTAAALLRHRDAAPAPVCFLSQQLAEKVLKAAQVYFLGDDAPKMHNLQELAHPLLKHVPALERLRADLDHLSEYDVRARSPTELPIETFTWERAESAFTAAQRIAEVVQKVIRV